MEETMGRLKSHEERIRGPLETSGNQLLLTDGQLLLNREEWLKKVSPNLKGKRDNEFRNKDGNRGYRDKSKVRCFNCSILGHYACECRKPKREKEQKQKLISLKLEMTSQLYS